MDIRLKRIYEDPEHSDGWRVLVDRLWPRGVSKERAHLDAWYKDLTPSDELRKRYHRDEAGWEEFRTAYREELGRKEEELDRAIAEMKEKERVTFLFAAKDTAQTHAQVLRDVILEQTG